MRYKLTVNFYRAVGVKLVFLLKGRQRLRVFENRMLRRMFVLKRESDRRLEKTAQRRAS
jgi:hypothetical protein